MSDLPLPFTRRKFQATADSCPGFVARFGRASGWKSVRSLLGAVALLQCWGAPRAAASSPLTVSYNLAASQRVSINIYNSSGRIVRELLHGAARKSGANSDPWDGRDDEGNQVPPGTYNWKMLAVPGFSAEYITSPGANYALDHTASYWAQSVGCHGGPQTVAVDATGLYVAGGGENLDATMVKQSLAGTSRLWSAMNLVVWDAPASLAPVGTSLWARYKNGNIYRQDNATSAVLGNFSATYNTEKPSDMTADATNVIVCYPAAGLVRWLDYTGNQTRSVSVAGAATVDVASDGTVYVISGTELRKIAPAESTSTVLASGLVAPRRAAVNPANGDIYVLQNGSSQQVKRFSSAGALLNTYGAAGGRVDGLYATQKVSFRGGTDIAVESNGNFWVAEAESAPRRVARFNSAGSWLSEYYGGQAWAPWIFAEPGNLNYVWMCSAWGDMMRCQIDYANKTWSVHSTYHYDGMADGLIEGHRNGAVWEGRLHGGELYICRINATPEIFKVDRTNWKIVPVVRGIGDLGHDAFRYPQWAKDRAASLGAKSMLWTDENGDGRPLNADGSLQTGEVRFFPSTAAHGNATATDKDLNYLFLKGTNIVKYGVTTWTGSGSPVYGNYPAADTIAAAPPRMGGKQDDRWSAFLAADDAGNTWGAFNPNITGWGSSSDAFVARWNSAGTLSWQSGRKGTLPGGTRTFRRIYGFISNGSNRTCLVVAPFSIEWPTEGVTPVFVYDQDGLYAGPLMGAPLNMAVANCKYGLGGEALAGTINKDASGNVYFFGHWVSEGRVYKITGWDNWQRASGTVNVALSYSAPPAIIEATGPNSTGSGLLAQYWTGNGSYDPGFTGTPVITRVDPSLDLTFNTNNSPANSPTGTANWSARWTGTLVPRRTGWHMFQQNRGAGSWGMLWVNKVIVTTATISPNFGSSDRNAGPGRAVWLKAGVPVPITLQYRSSPSPEPHGVLLQWSEPECNNAFTTVPSSQLFPSTANELSGPH